MALVKISLHFNPWLNLLKSGLGNDVFDGGVLLTADTGYASEDNMKHLFEQNINAIVLDTMFRQSDPKITNSESVKIRKVHRQKIRKDQSKTSAKILANEFDFNKESLICVCPHRNEIMCHGDHFGINGMRYHRVNLYLKNSRARAC